MTEQQQYRVIADRTVVGDKIDFETWDADDLLVYRYPGRGNNPGDLVRIERPVPTTDEPPRPSSTGGELVAELDEWAQGTDDAELRSLLNRAGDHIEFIETDAHYAPQPPTREQIAETLRSAQYPNGWWPSPPGEVYQDQADAVLALFQNGADR